MRSLRSHVFAFPHTFLAKNSQEVIHELQGSGLTGVNLALNYHASRDFLLRQGPRLEYLQDGFHYYRPNLASYSEGSIKPSPFDHLVNNEMLDSVISAGNELNFEVNAWAVFLHNSALGKQDPTATVTNVYGNHFLSELCPANPKVRGYVAGLTADLSARGISSLAIESLHFHGARHGEHHERFFVEMSKVTEFLLSLCFCQACINRFKQSGGDGHLLKARVTEVLKPFIEDEDPWLSAELTQDTLANILGLEILAYLNVREETVSSLYKIVSEIAHSAQVTTRYVDQAPLIDPADQAPLSSSWKIGIDNRAIRDHVDIVEPLNYRQSASEIQSIAEHYRQSVGGEIVSILRPTYPDNVSKKALVDKVQGLKATGVNEVDFYLLDTMRPRDLKWIKEALA
jgi:hypothetical protein